MRATSTLLALPALALALSTMAACADPKPPVAPTSAEAPKTAEPRFADLTAGDCQQWADHFAARLKDATRRRLDECSSRIKAAGGNVGADDSKEREATDAEADRLHALIIDQCSQQVGAAYLKSDAACYLGAKKMEDWKACPFQSMFFSDYKAVAKNHEKMFEDRCQSELKKVAGNGTASSG